MSSELFSANTQIAPSLSKNGRRENGSYSLLTLLLFLGASFSLWEFVFEACNMVASVISGCPQQAEAELQRMLPLILTAFTYLVLCRRMGRAFSARDLAHRARVWKGSGILALGLGMLIALYVVWGYSVGTYARAIEGNPSALYPLDVLLGGVLFAGCGMLMLRYGKKLPERGSSLPFRKNSRRSIGSVVSTVFGVVPAMAGMCGFAACCYGFAVMDWDHGQTMFNIALWLNYFAAAALLFSRRYVLAGLKEKYLPAGEKQMGLRHLLINAVLLVFYLVSVQLYPEAPNQNAFGLLPIEYTASMHAFPVLYGLNNLLTPLVWLIRGAKGKRTK